VPISKAPRVESNWDIVSWERAERVSSFGGLVYIPHRFLGQLRDADEIPLEINWYLVLAMLEKRMRSTASYVG
jgi:hypothetical protein